MGLTIALSIAALVFLFGAIFFYTKVGKLKTELQSASRLAEADKLAAEQRIADTTARLNEANSDLSAAQEQLVAARIECTRLSTRIDETEKAMAKQAEEYRRLTDEAEKRFNELAAKALANNSEVLRTQNANTLDEVMKPMREHIENFRRILTEQYEKESTERSNLAQEVLRLNQLSTVVSRETQRLTDALKGNSRMQGDWGEMILSEILTGAGLREGLEFSVQPVINGEGKSRLRPDVIINYADGRKLIVDSKVSIQDYLRMLNADTPTAREQLAKAHVESVKKHVNELRRKEYQDCLDGNSFDYVLMFIPHEGAFMAAVDTDPMLWQEACRDRVLIVSPAQLVPIAQIVERLWRQKQQDQNAVKIAEEASKMLDKLNGLFADLKKIGDTLNNARDQYDNAINKLATGRGNLLKRSADMQALGVKVKKSLPEQFQRMLDTSDPDEEAEQEEAQE